MQVWEKLRIVVACFFVFIFAAPPPSLFAQSHVVSPSELQHASVAATQARARNIEILNNFFSGPLAQKALKDHHISLEQVKSATMLLDDADLAQLAAKADKAQHDFAAGALTDHLLVLIVIAIAVILIIVLAVKL
jgi:hypothetical protein